jgi:hypothetical protein
MSNTDHYASLIADTGQPGQVPPPPGPQEPRGDQPQLQPVPPPGQPIRHDPLAKWAFITVWFVPLAGIILGHISNHQRRAAQMARDGVAVAALWLGYIFAALWTLFWIVMIAVAAATPATSVAAPPPPAAAAPATQPSADTPTEAPAPATDPTGVLGTAATVTDSSGNAYSVTAKQVIDPARPGSDYDTPDNGKHFVGVVFTVKATSGKLDDAADNCARLIGSNGQSYDSTVSSIAGYDGTSTLLKLNAGEQQTVAVVFQVPDGVHPATVKWTPDSGMADSTATWQVTTTQAAAPQAAGPAVPVGYTDAGDGVYAGPNTSTAFALAVHQAWLDSGKAATVVAYSSVTHQSYTMTQTGSSPYVFQGGNNASVKFWD